MLFNKLALTLFGIVAVVVALPTPSTNVALDMATKRDTVVDALELRGCNLQSPE